MIKCFCLLFSFKANLKISKGQAVILVLGVKLQVQAKEFPMTKVKTCVLYSDQNGVHQLRRLMRF